MNFFPRDVFEFVTLKLEGFERQSLNQMARNHNCEKDAPAAILFEAIKQQIEFRRVLVLGGIDADVRMGSFIRERWLLCIPLKLEAI